MADRELCSNGTKSKYRYRTRAQAEKKAKAARGIHLHVYECRHCGGWHLTSQEQLYKGVAPPSAAKLRRKLAEAANQIRATEKRLTVAEKSYFEELLYVERETARIMAGRIQ